MGILDTPLSKRGILKALGQDPAKSDVLTVATSPSGEVGKSALSGAGALAIAAGSLQPDHPRDNSDARRVRKYGRMVGAHRQAQQFRVIPA